MRRFHSALKVLVAGFSISVLTLGTSHAQSDNDFLDALFEGYYYEGNYSDIPSPEDLPVPEKVSTDCTECEPVAELLNDTIDELDKEKESAEALRLEKQAQTALLESLDRQREKKFAEEKRLGDKLLRTPVKERRVRIRAERDEITKSLPELRRKYGSVLNEMQSNHNELSRAREKIRDLQEEISDLQAQLTSCEQQPACQAGTGTDSGTDTDMGTDPQVGTPFGTVYSCPACADTAVSVDRAKLRISEEASKLTGLRQVKDFLDTQKTHLEENATALTEGLFGLDSIQDDTERTEARKQLQEQTRANATLLKSVLDQLESVESDIEKSESQINKAGRDMDQARQQLQSCEQTECKEPAPSEETSLRFSVGPVWVNISVTGASGQSTPLNGSTGQQRSAQAISGGFLEESVVESDDSLNGIRLGVAFDKPLTDSAGTASGLSRTITELADRLPVERAPGAETLRVRASVVDADGSASAVRPVGELSAIILADESPLFGPGLALLRDGQRARIDTELRQLQLEAGVSVPVGNTVGTSAGLGLVLQSFDLEHDMFQQDISFPEVSATTDLDVNDLFIGPKLTLNKSSRAGDWDILWELHAAPGLLFGDGDVTQRVNIFDATDRIRLSDSHTKLALQAGVRGAVFKMITRQIALGFTGGIQYQSANSAWRNPLLVSDQPANLETDSTTTFDIGAFIYIPLGPQPVN